MDERNSARSSPPGAKLEQSAGKTPLCVLDTLFTPGYSEGIGNYSLHSFWRSGSLRTNTAFLSISLVTGTPAKTTGSFI